MGDNPRATVVTNPGESVSGAIDGIIVSALGEHLKFMKERLNPGVVIGEGDKDVPCLKIRNCRMEALFLRAAILFRFKGKESRDKALEHFHDSWPVCFVLNEDSARGRIFLPERLHRRNLSGSIELIADLVNEIFISARLSPALPNSVICICGVIKSQVPGLDIVFDIIWKCCVIAQPFSFNETPSKRSGALL